MGLKVVVVQDDSEFEELIRAERDAFEEPLDHILNLFGPCLGSSLADRQEALEGLTARQNGLYRTQAAATWIKVVEDMTGELLGGAEWHIYHSNPYQDDSKVDCFWFEEGENREIANEVMDQYLTPRRTYMSQPHAFLDICFTKPSARRRGVGRLLVEWGLEQADKLNYGTYVDSSDMGSHLYKHYGFVMGGGHQISPNKLTAAQRDSQVGQMLLPLRWWPMYRPSRGGPLQNTKELPWSGAKAS